MQKWWKSDEWLSDNPTSKSITCVIYNDICFCISPAHPIKMKVCSITRCIGQLMLGT